MITAILLAAGESRRMGRPKALLPYGNGSVIGSVVRSLQRCPIDELVVVAGREASALADELAEETGSIRIVRNERYREGMLTSVQCGLAAAAPETEWFLIALVDQPAIDPRVVSGLIETARASRQPIVIPTFEGRRGHPLLFRAELAPEVRTFSGEVGLRELMQRHPDEILHVPVHSDTILRDMDTPEEYERELERARDRAP